MGTNILALQWMDHSNVFSQAIANLRTKDAFTDATLACEGKFYPVHKFILSTCSEYFSAIFEWTPCVNPVIVINNIPSENLESILDFIYKGEANVPECHIQEVMKAAECLHIKGLSLHHDDSLIAKSPLEKSHTKKRKIDSEKQKKEDVPFVKPHVESHYYQQQPSPTPSSSSYIARPTPTPPPNPPVHSVSPLALSSSPSLQSQFQSSSIVETLKPGIIIPSLELIDRNSHIKALSQASCDLSKEVKCSPSQIESVGLNQQMRNSYHDNNIIADQSATLMFPTLRSLVSSEESSVVTMHMAPNAHCANISQSCSQNVRDLGLQANFDLDSKMIGIGEELHLDAPVKGLEISTRGARPRPTAAMPEILEGLVDMRHLYEKPARSDHLQSQESNTSESLYDFSEDLPVPETSGLNRLNKLKDQNLKTYSNKKNNNLQFPESFLKMDSDDEDSDQFNYSSSMAISSPLVSELHVVLPRMETNATVAVAVDAAKPRLMCTICSRVFKKKDPFDKHMRTHLQFPRPCATCSFKCSTSKELISHRKIHANIKCDLCSYTTSKNTYLKRHMMVHDKEKQLKCSECSYTTLRMKQMNNHMQNRHPGN